MRCAMAVQPRMDEKKFKKWGCGYFYFLVPISQQDAIKQFPDEVCEGAAQNSYFIVKDAEGDSLGIADSAESAFKEAQDRGVSLALIQ